MNERLGELFIKLNESLARASEYTVEFGKGKKIVVGKLRKEAQESKKLWQEVRIVSMDILKSMPIKKRQTKLHTE